MMKGKVVIVTGAAKGIGRYTAKTFAEAGAKVAVADVAPLDTVAIELRELGADVLPMKCDVRHEAEVRRMVQRVVKRFGRIDVLVNNAAIVTHFMWGIPRWPRIPDMDKKFWDKVIQTNLGGTWLCTKHVLPYMERQHSGHVITLFGGGQVGSTTTAYAVSKDAIRSFAQFAAGEVRDSNVCVVIVNPGAAIATEDAPAEARRRMPGPEFVGNRFVLAAQAGMELSGKLLDMKDGKLVVVPDPQRAP
jgi:NAD(P)-dependent dehydrogenase (short-subunit alcohol dehydrogenase family)